MRHRTPIVAVVGSALCSPHEMKLAEAVGRVLAEAGATLICGGGSGVMEAACRGAKQANGLTIGILPGFHASDANPFVDIPIVTGLGEARNVIIVRTAQVVIAVGGEFGTLSEIAFALKLGRPVIGLETWELAKAGQPYPVIVRALTPEEAVRLALRSCGRLR
ncbi:MAG: TIGR00725 family protein [Anaerolineae bacterium]|nr:TIGR00725 family protein [Anaerolineae bacterium]